MKTLEECIAKAMDCDSAEIVPFLPYILRNFYEIGSSAELIAGILKEIGKDSGEVSVLDLGCGKGAVCARLSESLGCSCLGIDGIGEFIETAASTAREKNLDNCRFIRGDIREEVSRAGKFDVIILGSVGPVFGSYRETLVRLKDNLTPDGVIILDDGYIPDGSGFRHETALERSRLLSEIEEAGMRIIKEYAGGDVSGFGDYARQFKNIEARCRELALRHPDKKELFEGYIKKQEEEYRNLEENIICSTMVIGR